MRRPRGGFTLLEVILALSILAMAVVLLLAVRNESIETATHALELRRLQMLGDWKMGQVLAGEEENVSGDFRDEDLDRDYEEYRWSLDRTDRTVSGARKDVGGAGGDEAEVEAVDLELRITGPSGQELVLYGFYYEEAERGEDEGDGSSSGSGDGGDPESSGSGEGDDAPSGGEEEGG